MPKESVFIPITDNGMGLSRTSWGMSMFVAALSGVLAGRRVEIKRISFPYPGAAMDIATAYFLKSGCDRMLNIDTDEEFEPRDIEYLLSHEELFVSGIYPLKRPGLTFPIEPLESDPEPFAEDGRPPLREVARCARGFLNLHRDVFEKLKSLVPVYLCTETSEIEHNFWQTLPGGHSEDFAFCDMWRSVGGKVYVDSRIRAKHEGSCSYPIPGTY